MTDNNTTVNSMTAEIRACLYTYLTANSVVTDWYQPFVNDDTLSKPYGVIVVGEQLRSVNNRLGGFRNVEIWPYVRSGSFIALDNIVNNIRSSLERDEKGCERVFETASKYHFVLEWVHEGRDFYDPDLKALTRKLDYRIPLRIWT